MTPWQYLYKALNTKQLIHKLTLQVKILTFYNHSGRTDSNSQAESLDQMSVERNLTASSPDLDSIWKYMKYIKLQYRKIVDIARF